MKIIWLICGFALAGLFFTGCSTTGGESAHFPDFTPQPVAITNSLDPTLLRPPTNPFVLGPGDQVEIETIGNPLSRATATVGLDGKIYYSLLPGIDVWGLTISQAQAVVEQALGQYLRSPRVALSLRGVRSKHVWLLGRMNLPGIYNLTGPTTLLEALSMAGGVARNESAITTSDLGDLRHSFVMRQGKALPVDFTALLQEGDMSQNIYLQPDDFVFVPSSLSQEVYVMGAVLAPRTVPYQDPMTLASAISAANGPGPNAYLSHVAIVRGSLTKPELTVVNFNSVMSGKTPNIRLEPGDIVYVPLSPYRYLTDYANLIVQTFVQTWSANEAIASTTGFGTVGVSVPVTPSSAGAK